MKFFRRFVACEAPSVPLVALDANWLVGLYLSKPAFPAGQLFAKQAANQPLCLA